MAILYHMRDGAPPNNITHMEDISLDSIKERFKSVKKNSLVHYQMNLPILWKARARLTRILSQATWFSK